MLEGIGLCDGETAETLIVVKVLLKADSCESVRKLPSRVVFVVLVVFVGRCGDVVHFITLQQCLFFRDPLNEYMIKMGVVCNNNIP